MKFGVSGQIEVGDKTVTQNKFAFGFEEVSAQTSLSVAFLRKEARAGRLKTKKFGARRLVLNEDLQTYLKGENNGEK